MNNLVVILGPTASGKTKLAVNIANLFNGEIISADSRQVYKDMDIGTGKDIEEYVLDGKQVKHHLVDVKPPGYKYNINEYRNDALVAYNSILTKNKLPILCGGSGLYIETFLKGNQLATIPVNKQLRTSLETLSKQELEERYSSLNQRVKNMTDNSTIKRIIRAIEIDEHLKFNTLTPFENRIENYVIIGLKIDRELRRKKITERLEKRIKNGLIEEVEKLMRLGLTPEQLTYYGLEYKWVTKYLINEIDKSTMFERLNVAIHQFAKRQQTWFRRMEKQGYKINWIDVNLPLEEKLKQSEVIIKHII